ncbi:MAG TPA: response regulator transcription factor [Bacteroidota bacterium]|nr:response regulator transcription factor [Bacteroidota bacterium]
MKAGKNGDSRTILVVDDDPDIVMLLRYNLEKSGYGVSIAVNGNEAMDEVRHLPDLVLLDVMLPGLDGWEVARRIKTDQRTRHIPIVFLTAKTSEVDEITGLGIGAVDYLTKPIRVKRLLARIESALRLADANAGVLPMPHEPVTIGPLTIDVRNYSVRVDGTEVQFAKKEFEILACLASRAGQIVGREELIRSVWRNTIDPANRSLDVHITKIRQKLGAYGNAIETLKRVGYRLKT